MPLQRLRQRQRLPSTVTGSSPLKPQQLHQLFDQRRIVLIPRPAHLPADNAGRITQIDLDMTDIFSESRPVILIHSKRRRQRRFL